MKVFSTLNAQVRQNLLILFAAGLLFWSSLASLMPTLPLYIQSVGASKQEIGIAIGSFAVGMLLFRGALGRMADRRGRKIVLLIGMIVATVAPLGYLAVKSIPLLILLRAFHGICYAAFATAFIALVADFAPVENRGEVIGYMSLVSPIGMAIGPALGGYLQQAAGFIPLFILSTLLASLALLCSARIVTPIVKHPSSNNDNRFWRILVSPRARVPAIILLLVGFAVGGLTTFAPLFIKSTGVDLNPGLFYTAAAIASFGVRLFTGRASDRRGRGLFVTLSLVVYTAAMLLLSLANSSAAFLFAAIAEGSGSGILFPMLSTIIADRSQPHERGRMFGLCMIGLDVGIAIAGPVIGSVTEQIGYRNVFTVAAGLTVTAMLIFLTQSSKDLPGSLRFGLGLGPDGYALNKLEVKS